ncbi:MAG: hydrolase 2, exosortase A system-associated [Pseudomonadota bacterium]
MNRAPPARPFFLGAGRDQRFCLFHEPAPGVAARGAIIYLHPFAEEMNKSRRMAALQSRAFAARGHAVLQIDLYGCGDSGGDFGDARWPIWHDDVALACDWLARRTGAPLCIWGLRLGALLALDWCQRDARAARLILWHPILKGKTCIDQFLRLRLASEMVAGGGAAGSAREQLAAGATLEIGGYALAPQLAAAIDALDAAALTPRVPLHWFDLASAGQAGAIAPAVAERAGAWRAAGVDLQLHAVRGLPFWASGEIVECHALLDATREHCA